MISGYPCLIRSIPVLLLFLNRLKSDRTHAGLIWKTNMPGYLDQNLFQSDWNVPQTRIPLALHSLRKDYGLNLLNTDSRKSKECWITLVTDNCHKITLWLTLGPNPPYGICRTGLNNDGNIVCQPMLQPNTIPVTRFHSQWISAGYTSRFVRNLINSNKTQKLIIFPATDVQSLITWTPLFKTYHLYPSIQFRLA